MMASLDDLKRQAAEKAVEFIESGMIVGLGTGSTAGHAIRAIEARLQDGRLQAIFGVPTSKTTQRLAEASNIPLTTLTEHPTVDLTIDGADEIDPKLDLIKGLGGALLHEKVVAAASKQVIIVGDHTKHVNQLGSRAPVPVEVIAFAQGPVTVYLESLGARVVQRMDAGTPEKERRPFTTDEGNIILDCYFGPIAAPPSLAQAIRAQPGVVEHGLFLGIATMAITAAPAGITVFHRA
jgi:ribose 5-phosphate isomerase A